ncbi:MAG: ATP synthase F0 subunit B [Deltaproteobacteria bacterium]|nr:ATP synthase F0 subunit B [Deltaproteobacteria bacterium]
MKIQRSKAKIQKFLSYLPFTVHCSLLTVVSTAFAAEEGGHDGSAAGSVWRVINFTILVMAIFLIARYLKLKDFFADRKESIRIGLEEARKAKEEAERKVLEFEVKFNLLHKKIEEIHQEIKAEGEIEKKKIIEEAIRAAEKIKEQARLAAEQEIKKAKQEIKGEVAKVAVEMAEEILRHELTAADQERLIKEYMEKVRVH